MHTETNSFIGMFNGESNFESSEVTGFHLICQTENELMKGKMEKEKKDLRRQLTYEAADNVARYIADSDGKNIDGINDIIWDLMEKMDYSLHELECYHFSHLRQKVMKLARQHECIDGKTRSLYINDGILADAYNTYDLKFLAGKRQQFKSISETYSKKALAMEEQMIRVAGKEKAEQMILEFESESKAV